MHLLCNLRVNYKDLNGKDTNMATVNEIGSNFFIYFMFIHVFFSIHLQNLQQFKKLLLHLHLIVVHFSQLQLGGNSDTGG